jgi:mRNA-degrading endonuclease RelE of RelBE toxin-antitoxin system
MHYERKPSFDRSLRRLPQDRRHRVERAIEQLVMFFEAGPRPQGLGLKRLRGDVWEVRAGLSDRVIFRLTADLVEFVIVGNHDDIVRFLKQS